MIPVSPDIDILDFAVLVDLSTGTPTVKFINMSTGPNMVGMKWLFNVFTPNNTGIHTSSFNNPDVSGLFTNYTIPEQLPQPGGNVIWSGSAYRFRVDVQDSAGNKYFLEKTKEIKRPTGNQTGSSYGAGVIDIQARCTDAMLYAEDQTNYAYMKLIQPSAIIQKKFTLLYPATDQGVFPPPFVINDFTNGLIPISYSGDGYTAVLESIVQYDLGDYVKVQLKYKFKECFPVQCNIDLCQITCEYNDMVTAAQKDGCDKELADKLLLINAKINMALIGKMQPLCKVDVGKIVAEIKEIGGFTCECDNGKGIVALINPAGATGITDCNAVVACVNGIFNKVDPNCLFPGWASSSLLIKLQNILDLLSGDKCGCSAPADVTLLFTPYRLRWRSTNDAFKWRVERMLNNNGFFEQLTAPSPNYIGNGFWELDLSALVYNVGGTYVFYVTAICGTNNTSTTTASPAYIPNGCTPLSFDNVTQLPNAVVGQAYVHNRVLNGTAPYTIVGALLKPAWMNIAIVGNILQFTGTPGAGDVQSAINVSVGVGNGCGFESLSAGMTVTAICVAASFVAPVLPDAQNGQAYGVNVALVGSGPFSLSGVSAPAWMNFNIAGTTLQITGTPVDSDVANAVDVKFTIFNNCGKQRFEDIINILQQTCIPVSFTNPTLPDAQIGQAYVFNIALSGTAPFNLTGINKPAWMAIAIVGSTVQITGTPPVGSNSADVLTEFTVNNGCGSQSLSDSINVNDNCIPISFLFVPSIPNAIANQAYVFNRPLTGSAPFFLTGINKPAWMNIQIVGNVLEFSGTPSTSDIASVVPVGFIVNNNCGSRGDTRSISVSQAAVNNFKFGTTELDTTTGSPTEADFVQSVNTAIAAGTTLTAPFTPSGNNVTADFQNTTDKVMFIAVPIAEDPFTLWSEEGNALQTNLPIAATFATPGGVWFKTVANGDNIYITRFQTQVTGRVILTR